MRIFLLYMLLLSYVSIESFCKWNMDVKNSTTIDMSKTCVNNLEENVYLPYGMGSTDALVLIITNKVAMRRCSITFHREVLKEDIMKIFVIEFLTDVNNVYSLCNVGNLYIIENYVNPINCCKLFNSTQYQNPFIFTTKFNLKFKIHDFRKDNFQAFKITATSTRILKGAGTCDSKEISCNFNNTRTCINKELQCDGNLNCGRKNYSDEDKDFCKKRRGTSLVSIISCSIVISAFLIYSVIYRIIKWSPQLKKQLRYRYKNEEHTIFLSNFSPAIKTYISKNELKMLHLRVASISDSSSRTADEFYQHASRGVDRSPELHKKDQ